MNYYDILELDNKCTSDDIKEKYYNLAKIYHPDKFKGGGNKFLNIKQAYDILSDPIMRYKYDLELEFSNLFGRDIKFNLSSDEIDILKKYYSKIRSSTEFRFIKLLLNSYKIKWKFQKKYNLVNTSKIKYIDATNIFTEYIININLTFEDTYTNKCKILIIKTVNYIYHIFITHTNIHYLLKNINDNFLKINIITNNSTEFIIDNYDIYINHKISIHNILFKQEYTLILPNKVKILTKINSFEPILLPLLGLKDPISNVRGRLIITHQTNLLEIKKNVDSIPLGDKKILYKYLH